MRAEHKQKLRESALKSINTSRHWIGGALAWGILHIVLYRFDLIGVVNLVMATSVATFVTGLRLPKIWFDKEYLKFIDQHTK